MGKNRSDSSDFGPKRHLPGRKSLKARSTTAEGRRAMATPAGSKKRPTAGGTGPNTTALRKKLKREKFVKSTAAKGRVNVQRGKRAASKAANKAKSFYRKWAE